MTQLIIPGKLRNLNRDTEEWRVNDWQSVNDLESIPNSCNVSIWKYVVFASRNCESPVKSMLRMQPVPLSVGDDDHMPSNTDDDDDHYMPWKVNNDAGKFSMVGKRMVMASIEKCINITELTTKWARCVVGVQRKGVRCLKRSDMGRCFYIETTKQPNQGHIWAP